jgi:hypothetical protein
MGILEDLGMHPLVLECHNELLFIPYWGVYREKGSDWSVPVSDSRNRVAFGK